MNSLLEKIKPQNEGQLRLIEALKSENYNIIGIFGPTGTGKSLLTLAYGIDSINEGKFRRFLIVKQMIDVISGKELTITEAKESYEKLARQYMLDVIGQFLTSQEIDELIKTEKVIFIDSHFLKGRTFDESIIFLDDAQYIKYEALLELLIRLGRKSKLIIAADPIFQRSAYASMNTIKEILMNEKNATVVELGVKDIVREGAKFGIRFMLEYILRTRKLSENEVKVLEILRNYAPDADIVTLMDLEDLIKKYGISKENVPRYLVIVKPDYLGRFIGKKGERVNAMEKELNAKIRAIELDIDLANYIKAIHPVSWIFKKIDIDFMGSYIMIRTSNENLGPLMGQKGAYIRFINEVSERLLGIGVKVIQEEEKVSKKK